MKIMVVGADHLGTIAKNLQLLGIAEVEHVKGRNVAAQTPHISETIALVLVLVDYVNHNTMKQTKLSAKARSIPVIFAKRSWSSIQGKLIEFGLNA